jgi:DNA-binding NtrC family response regulator
LRLLCTALPHSECRVAERVLIVDDDAVQRRLLTSMAAKAGYEAVACEGGEGAVRMLLATERPAIDCIVLDLVMPDLDGLGVLAKMREAGIAVPVIVQTAHGGIDNVITAMRAGAVDFVVKPVGPERLAVSLRNAMAARALEGEIARIKRSRSGTLTFRDIITRSPNMQAALRAAEKAVRSAIPVLIEGESGVGKELIARAIHGSGDRRTKPFVAVNCGALPENLVESILFGHEKGAFTGATDRHDGKFVEASAGTLFLDEVGELPHAVQVKLLRAIQEGEVEAVGGKKPINVNVRIISATNRNLLTDVNSGRFREDLFYRLHVYPIMIPPLRKRPEDIPALVRHFLLRFAAEEGKRINAVSKDTLEFLSSCHWPGNVRQLENAIFRAVVLAESHEIGRAEFPQLSTRRDSLSDLQSQIGTETAALLQELPGRNETSRDADRDGARIEAPPLADDRVGPSDIEIPSAAPAHGSAVLNLLDDSGNVRPLEEIEADAIRFALSHYRGQMSEAARRLRIGRSTLYRKLDLLDIAEPQGA